MELRKVDAFRNVCFLVLWNWEVGDLIDIII